MNRRSLLKLGGLMAAAGSTQVPALLAQYPAVQRSRVGDAPVKITKVEAFVIRSPKDNTPEDKLVVMPPPGTTRGGAGLWDRTEELATAYPRGYMQATLVKITTDQGLIGWGQCHAPLAPRVHKTVISDLFAPVIMGQDARDVEVLWERMYSSQRLRGFGTGFFIQSLSGVDLALWDILGQYVGLPLYRLLGGKFREKIATYLWLRGASGGALRDNALQTVGQGYTALKMNMRGLDELDRVAAVAEAIKGKAQILVVSVGLKLHEAVKIGKELDRLGNVGWLQEPLLPEDSAGYAQLAEAVDTPICYGAFLGNRFRFRDVFAARAVDIINPDICYCGGLTESRRIAMLADVHGILWSPHVSMGAPPYMAASMHLSAATPNFVIMESANQAEGPFGNVLLKQPLEYHGGYAKAPERPGLGIEFDEKELAKVTIG